MSKRGFLGSLLIEALAVVLIACGGHNPPAFDTPPVLANREEITEAMRGVGAGMEARVVLLLRIDEQGHVRDARIEEGSGSEELDDAALWIAERMRFEPARAEGRPVAAAVQVPVTFDVVVPTLRSARLRNGEEIAARMAREYGALTGQVRLKLRVGPDGWVDDTRPGRGADPELLAAAQELAERLRFQPASRGGSVLSAWVDVTFEFAGRDSRVLVEDTET